MVHLERDSGSVTFVRIKVIFQVFDQLVTFFKPACLMYEGPHGTGWSHQEIDKRDFPKRDH